MKAIPPKGTIAFLQAWNIIVLAIIILRFWIRRCKLRVRKSPASIAADVQLILAWVIITAAQGATFNELIDIIHYRNAKIQDLLQHPLLQPKFHKVNFGLVLAYFTVLWLIKGAFIAFFFDLFPRHGLRKKLRMVLYGTVIYTVAGYIACVLTHLLLCRPLETAWKFGNMNCNSLLNPATLTATTFINITTDVILMALPITILRTLSLRRREFIGLTLVFLIGLTTIVCAIIRYVVIHETNNDVESIEGKINDTSVIQVWSFIEVYFAIITFCLPAFRVLLNSRRRKLNLNSRYAPHFEQGMYGCGTLEQSRLRKGHENNPRLQSEVSITRGDPLERIDSCNDTNFERGHMSPVSTIKASDVSSNKEFLPPMTFEKQVGVTNHEVRITPSDAPL